MNPATGETLSTHPATPPDEVDDIVRRAHAAHLAWRDTPFSERADRLRALAGLLRERKDEYGRLMTAEMGKPIAQAVAEAEKCATAADYYAEHGEAFLAPVPVETDASTSYWTYRPLGVILAIMPWNFPFWQVIRFATPALAAGNAGPPQARLERPRVRRGAGEALPRRRLSSRPLPQRLHRADASRRSHRASAGPRREPHRQRAGRPERGGARGSRA